VQDSSFSEIAEFNLTDSERTQIRRSAGPSPPHSIYPTNQSYVASISAEKKIAHPIDGNTRHVDVDIELGLHSGVSNIDPEIVIVYHHE